MPDSEASFKSLEELEEKLKNHLAKKIEGESSSSDIHETLIILFTLLFDFTEFGQARVAEKCGESLVQILGDSDLFLSSNTDDVETVIQALLIISALCNYSSARAVLVENTPILKICIDSLVELKGNDPEKSSLRDKILSCLSTLIRGSVNEAVDAGIVNPMIELLGNDEVVTDQKGAAGIILSLIEPERGQALGARVLLSGVVPLLLSTLAKKVPEDATAADKAQYKYLQVVGLRCVACVLRHQQLARESAVQFFTTEEGESHLRSVVEHAKTTSDVSKWIFAAEILVWLSTVRSCQGLLGRMGAKKALQKVVSEANPYGRWVSLVNQAVSVKAFPALWTNESIFHREQHAFLALWMNRYACGGLDASADANHVREKLCSEEWMAFATTLLSSPDAVTRKHAHTALRSLRGEFVGKPPTIISNDDSSKSSITSSSSRVRNNNNNNNNRTSKAQQHQQSLYEYHLLKPLGLEKSEEKKVIECLIKAKLPIHVTLRSTIQLEDIVTALSLSNLAPGTRLAVIDGIRELRDDQEISKTIVKNVAYKKVATASKIPKLQKQNKDVEIDKKHRGIETENTTIEKYPECFISYCWAQKEKVKILKDTLEDHGIRCWMDEQQMEGGSMLFQEIDQGISASDVVISCLSPEYTKSINCNREVLLAADRKKATIPIVIEDLEHWPPRGNMGPILAGKLYIKIHDEAYSKREKSTEVRQLIQSVTQLLNTTR